LNDINSAPNGRFVDYSSTENNPFLTSKAWLQSSDGVNWTFFQHDHQHLTFGLTTQPTLMVRVVDATQASDNYSARITLLMGRNDQKQAEQPMSSPIQNWNGITGPVCIWDYDFTQASGNTGGVASWVHSLGVASLGRLPGNLDKYVFLVAATVQGGSQTYTFSHDPDMDITC
jgi:hypothetical protein